MAESPRSDPHGDRGGAHDRRRAARPDGIPGRLWCGTCSTGGLERELRGGLTTAKRRIFAAQAAARRAGLDAGSFSFNLKGGRCEECAGAGLIVVEMVFMADVHAACGHCGGRRYRPEVLAVEVRRRSPPCRRARGEGRADHRLHRGAVRVGGRGACFDGQDPHPLHELAARTRRPVADKRVAL